MVRTEKIREILSSAARKVHNEIREVGRLDPDHTQWAAGYRQALIDAIQAVGGGKPKTGGYWDGDEDSRSNR